MKEDVLTLNTTYRVRLYTHMSPQIGINVFFVRIRDIVSGAPTQLTLMDDIWSETASNYADLLTDSAQVYGIDCAQDYPNISQAADHRDSTPLTGTAGSKPCPSQVCGMFTKLTGTAGPKGRGRTYISFPDNVDVTASSKPIPTTGYMTRLGIVAADLVAYRSISGAAGTAVIEFVIGPPNQAAKKVTTGAVARQKWATHRSRGTYGAINDLPF